MHGHVISGSQEATSLRKYRLHEQLAHIAIGIPLDYLHIECEEVHYLPD